VLEIGYLIFALGFATPYMVDQDKANLASKVFFIGIQHV
jgi:hypothetical protein